MTVIFAFCGGLFLVGAALTHIDAMLIAGAIFSSSAGIMHVIEKVKK